VLFGLFLFGGLEFPQILVPLGGLASFGALGKYELLLDLFPGVRVRVLHLSECCHENWIVAWPTSLTEKSFPHFVDYINVDFDIPFCHDDFGGFLGQLYKCKWAILESGAIPQPLLKF
jgi:hypothetical protein